MKRVIATLVVVVCVLLGPMTAWAEAEAPEPGQEDFVYRDKEPQYHDKEPQYIDELPVPDLEGAEGGMDAPADDGQPELDGRPIGSVAGKYANIGDLFQHWETDGYPDYVGGVYSTDGSEGKLTVLLVGDDGSKAEEIRGLLVDDSGVSFGAASFSYNAMLAAIDEIAADYMGKEEPVYSVGIGWTSEAAGFGESGKEFRVVVSVDASVLADYTDRLHQRYGDMVVVETGGPVSLESDAVAISYQNGWLLPLLVTVAVVVGAGILIFNRTRWAAARQAADGTVVAQAAPVSRRETIEAVRDSETAPGEQVFSSILSRVEKEG
ncbi:MAG: hypothetical protein ACOYI4_03300 [Christensenellales bacterium]|jgi:hypothetical protein